MCGYCQYRVEDKDDPLFGKYHFVIFESERIAVGNNDDVMDEEDYYKYWNYKPRWLDDKTLSD